MRRERAAGLAMVLASLGFVVSLTLLNVDSFIVKQNVQRELRGDVDKSLTQGGRVELDAQYFLDLSDDAVPALANAFQNKSMPMNVREKVGAALFCKRYDRELNEHEIPWQSFHFSRFTADKIFADIESELDGYEITDTEWPVKINTPSGEEFSCYQYYYD
jgi:hypothetical protein